VLGERQRRGPAAERLNAELVFVSFQAKKAHLAPIGTPTESR